MIFLLLLVYKYPIKIKYYSEKTAHSSLNPLWFTFTGYTFCWPVGKGFKLGKKNLMSSLIFTKNWVNKRLIRISQGLNFKTGRRTFSLACYQLKVSFKTQIFFSWESLHINVVYSGFSSVDILLYSNLIVHYCGRKLCEDSGLEIQFASTVLCCFFIIDKNLFTYWCIIHCIQYYV